MNTFAVAALTAGFVVTAIGITLQLTGHLLFKYFGQDDTKELAGVVGFRVSAIFGIAVGLIFAASSAFLLEAKRDLQEETRLIGTLQFLASEAPDLKNRAEVQKKLSDYAERSLKELELEEGPSTAGRVTSNLLIESCRAMAVTEEDPIGLRWTKAEFQRSCSKLIDLRGKKRVASRESLVAKPFWVFFAVCFCFLAFLFGVFALKPLNIIFACIFYFVTGITGIVIYAASDPSREPGKLEASPLLKLLKKADQDNQNGGNGG